MCHTKWVMSHMVADWRAWSTLMSLGDSCRDMHEPCPMWMSHVLRGGYLKSIEHFHVSWRLPQRYACVMSYVNASCLIWRRRVWCKWVMSCMNESCLNVVAICALSCLLSLGDSRRDMHASCLVWTSHVAYEGGVSYVNESCPVWMRHVS